MTKGRLIYLKGILGAWGLKYKVCDVILMIPLFIIAVLKFVGPWFALSIILVAGFVYEYFVRWRLERKFLAWTIHSALEPVKSLIAAKSGRKK